MKAISSLLAVMLAGAADAQGSDTINVIGRTPEEVRHEAQEFVRKTGVTDQAVARWIEPVCPKVVGVSAEVAERVSRRIREVARTIGARAAEVPCEGNLMVSFTTNAGTVVKKIAARLPDSFKDLTPAERARLRQTDTPVRWWHLTQTRTSDGMRDMGNDVPPFLTSQAPGGVPLGGDVHLQYRSSVASTQMVRVLRVATVIVDVEKANGTLLDSVVDLAALVGLAEIRPTAEPPANSILALYAPQGPKELTRLDLDFLTTLYRLPLARSAIAHRGLLVRGLLNPVREKED